MCVSDTCLTILNTVNRGELQAMETAGKELDPSESKSCDVFRQHVTSVQSAIVHSYAMIAHMSIRESSPERAANLWREMMTYCEEATKVLWKLKNLYSGCGTPELYDLVLDYRRQAEERWKENLEDAQCQMPIPKGLFPSQISNINRFISAV